MKLSGSNPSPCVSLSLSWCFTLYKNSTLENFDSRISWPKIENFKNHFKTKNEERLTGFSSIFSSGEGLRVFLDPGVIQLNIIVVHVLLLDLSVASIVFSHNQRGPKRI